MEKIKVLIITIITFFILANPGEVFALAVPLEDAYWCNDFRWQSYEQDKSSIDWENGTISLVKNENDDFQYSGVLWTNDIRFRQDIYSLTLSGIYYTPDGTSILPYVKFDNDIREYPLDFNVTYKPQTVSKKLRLKIFLSTNNQDISPTVNEICISAKLQDRSERGIVNRDYKRVSDLKKISNILQIYYDDFGHYPVVNVNKNKKDDQWRLLKNVLSSASKNFNKDYIRRFNPQIVGVDTDYKYGYLTNNSGLFFVLWTQLEQGSLQYFNESWNGEVLDINCSEPIYCISSKVSIVPPHIPIIQYFEDSEEFNEIQGAEFVRQKNDTRVYLKIMGHRVWLRTPEIFTKAGGLWDKVNIFNSKITEPLLKFIKKANESTVYLVSTSGFKRAMISEQVLASYGQLSEVVTVDDSIVDLLPQNYLIRARGDTKVYFLDQKIKRWITSPEVLKRLGFDFFDVVEIDPMELDFYFEAAPIF